MRLRCGFALSLALSALTAAAARAAPIPAAAEQMIRAADRQGDGAAFRVTVDMARKAFPASDKEIGVLAASLDAMRAWRQRYKLSRLGFFQGWTGQGQVGAGNTTGNSKSTTLSVGLAFARAGLKWHHAFTATIDYQKDFGRESKGRYFSDYEGNYSFNDRSYALGVLSFEDNRFAGFNRRFSEFVGLGWRIIVRPDMNLSVEAGPAVRQTDFIAQGSENRLAGRAAVNYDWQVFSNLKFAEAASFYGESRDSTFTSNTALTANLIGALSAQLSYLVQYESKPPQPGMERVNTTSRLTLVYNF